MSDNSSSKNHNKSEDDCGSQISIKIRDNKSKDGSIKDLTMTRNKYSFSSFIFPDSNPKLKNETIETIQSLVQTQFMIKAQVYLNYCIHQLKKPESHPMDVVKVIYR